MDLITRDEEDEERNASEVSSAPPEKKQRSSLAKAIEFDQAPVIPVVYTDPATKRDKCLVVLLGFNGVDGYNIDVKERNKEQTLIVKYNWPEEMFDMTAMFTDSDDELMVQPTHPKLLAVETELRKFRENMEDSPVATVEIKLPVEVCMDPSSWHYTYNKKEDGNVILFVELECVRKDYVILKKEKFIKID